MSLFRLRRLESDYDAVRRLVHGHPALEIEGVSGSPPERYIIVYMVRSLRQVGAEVKQVGSHRMEIRIPSSYPRDAPVCRMLTPVFHPNIAPHVVCIGDHWTAAETLDAMILRVGEMLTFQSYNTKSPLNGHAAQWVEQNVDGLPLETTEFTASFSGLPAGAAAAAAADTATCSNCRAEDVALTDCAAKAHRCCADCFVGCKTCGTLRCVACGPPRCPVCAAKECANCGAADAESRCDAGHCLCEDCQITCEGCAAVLCLVCGSYPCKPCAAP